MKNICLLSLLVICLSGCIDQPSENPAAESSTKETQENKNNPTEKTNNVEVIKRTPVVEEPVTRPEDEEFLDITDSLDRPEPEKMPFLITNDAIGPFALEGNIDSVCSQYGLKWRREISWQDGSTFPVRVIFISEYKYVTMVYRLAESTNDKTLKPYSKYPDKYFFIDGDCEGFYFRNSSVSISETCEIFKTPEGIGVGSTFKELHDAYPDLIFDYGENSDGECFNHIQTKDNSNITFIFDCDALFDVTLDCKKENGSNYRPDAPILEIRISNPNEW